jgi:hypothetical protein
MVLISCRCCRIRKSEQALQKCCFLSINIPRRSWPRDTPWVRSFVHHCQRIPRPIPRIDSLKILENDYLPRITDFSKDRMVTNSPSDKKFTDSGSHIESTAESASHCSQIPHRQLTPVQFTQLIHYDIMVDFFPEIFMGLLGGKL